MFENILRSSKVILRFEDMLPIFKLHNSSGDTDLYRKLWELLKIDERITYFSDMNAVALVYMRDAYAIKEHLNSPNNPKYVRTTDTLLFNYIEQHKSHFELDTICHPDKGMVFVLADNSDSRHWALIDSLQTLHTHINGKHATEGVLLSDVVRANAPLIDQVVCDTNHFLVHNFSGAAHRVWAVPDYNVNSENAQKLRKCHV